MRSLILIAALSLLVMGCSKEAQDEDAAGFTPPTAQTRADFSAGLDRRFMRMDRNTDGAIQAEEMRGRRRTAGSDGADAEAASRPRRDNGGGRGGMVRALDKDGDGEVTRSEFVDGNLARFDKADANRDGTLTTDERRASGLFGRRRERGAEDAPKTS